MQHLTNFMNTFVNSNILEDAKKNYILFTDIGRDCDDTLALIYMLYSHISNKLRVKGIVVSGACLEERYDIVIYWLMRFNITDIAVIMSRDLKDNNCCITKNDLKCIKPYDEKEQNKVNEYKTKITTSNLLELLTNVKPINILAISSLTPLADLITYFPNKHLNIDKIYIQGSGLIENGKLIPDLREKEGSYNLKLDKLSSNIVFNKYGDELEFVFLGKETAYLINFNKKHFNAIDTASGINLSSQAEEGIINLTKDKPVFKRVFGNNFPKDFNMDDEEMFKEDNKFLSFLNKYSNPYDLILVYLAVYPELFQNPEILTTDKGSQHIQYNIKDDKEFKKSVEDMTETLLNSILTGCVFMM